MAEHAVTPEDAPTPERMPWEVWALVVGSFLVAVGYGIVAPALPVFARSFGVGVTAAAAVVSALPVLRLLFALVSGRLVARLGERAIYLAGLLIVAASTGACALARGYVELLVFRGLGGIGSSMFTVSAFSLLFRLAPPSRRGRASGLFTGGFLLGGISGPALGGGLVAVDVRAPFVVYALVLVLATVVVGALLLRSRLAGAVAVGDRTAAMSLTDAARQPVFRAALASGVATGWTIQGVRVALVPLFVTEVLHRPPLWSGIALTAFAVGDGLVLATTSGLSDRRGRRPVVIAGLALATVGTAGLGLVPDLRVLLACSVLAGAGAGLLQPAQGAALADLVRDRSGGPVLSGFQMAQDVGAIVGPVAVGAIVESTSYTLAFAVSAAVAAVALVVWVRVPPGSGHGSSPAVRDIRAP